MKKSFAFTLAEILIVLAIVGIVAVLTIPVLINKFEKQITVIRLKKFVAEFNQALQMVEVENGDRSHIYIPSNPAAANPVIADYIKPYFKIEKECKISEDASCFAPFTTNDGSSSPFNAQVQSSDSVLKTTFLLQSGVSFAYWIHGDGYRSGWAIFDINGPYKGPAKMGEDVFVVGWKLDKGSDLILFSSSERDDLLENCKTDGVNCLSLIIKDNWKISDDYPWRI